MMISQLPYNSNGICILHSQITQSLLFPSSTHVRIRDVTKQHSTHSQDLTRTSHLAVTDNVIHKTPRSGHPLLPFKEVGRVTSYQLNAIWLSLGIPQGVLGEYSKRLAPAPQDSKRTFGFQNLIKECRSTSKSKQWVFPGFSTSRIYGHNRPETTKDYFIMSNLLY